MPRLLSNFRLLLGSAMLMTSIAAHAAPMTFFGEDLNTAGDPNQVSPNISLNARNEFFANLKGVGTEDFESFLAGTTNPTLNFGMAGMATLTGSGSVAAGNDTAGRYATSGNQYYNAGANNFGVSFSSPIAAFGFYGIDIGDYGGHLALQLTDTNGVVSTLQVGNQVSSSGEISGSVLYFGFYDTGTQYTNIQFTNDTGGDVFAFDDLSVGSVAQVVPTVPLPASFPMFGVALLSLTGLGFLARGRSKTIGSVG